MVAVDVEARRYDDVHRQVEAQRLLPEDPLAVSEFHTIPGALSEYTSVNSSILGGRRKDGHTLGGFRILSVLDLLLKKYSPTIIRDMSPREQIEIGQYIGGEVAIGLGGAMTDKNAYMYEMALRLVEAGLVSPRILPYKERGGGKTVGVVADIDKYRNLIFGHRLLFGFQHAEHIARMNGRHTTAVDMNTDIDLMDIIWTRLSELGVPELVACQSPVAPFNGTGNPSETTAIGVWAATLIALERLGIKPEEAVFVIQGVGNVGKHNARLIGETYPDALVIITDIYKDKIKSAKQLFPGNQIHVVHPDNLFGTSTRRLMKGRPGVFMPSAREEVLDDVVLDHLVKLRFKLVAGAANDQFPRDDHFRPDLDMAEKYSQNGIVVVPDSAVNVGGVDHLHSKQAGLADDKISRLLVAGQNIMIGRILDETLARQVSPQRVFQEMVVDILTRHCLQEGIDPLHTH